MHGVAPPIAAERSGQRGRSRLRSSSLARQPWRALASRRRQAADCVLRLTLPCLAVRGREQLARLLADLAAHSPVAAELTGTAPCFVALQSATAKTRQPP